VEPKTKRKIDKGQQTKLEAKWALKDDQWQGTKKLEKAQI